ncbi:MAG TPA: alpha-2-macroglobulin [Candidatus Methylacidiphilales bacterium]|nr:alpha-2-macroglobulin [Candidatus Methylacidiphilales bacterium]
MAAISRRPILWSGLLLALVIAANVSWYVWDYYAHLPKPVAVTWYVVADGAQNASVGFEDSVVRLDLVGKDVNELVTLSPKLPGTWRCERGNRLTFISPRYWSAGTTFTVTFAHDLFSRHARLDTLTRTFTTRPFTVAISEAQFYVNPKDPSIKQVTATLQFTYPVDRASLEKNLALAMENGPNVFENAPSPTGRCTVTYDPYAHDFVAYVRSVNVAVPVESGHAILTVPTSVQAASGGASLAVVAKADVLIPSVTDLFHVVSAQATIVNDVQGEPQQTLVLNASVGVKQELLAKVLHAWVLPDPHGFTDPLTSKKIAMWSSPAQVSIEALAHAKAVALTPVPNDEEYATLYSFHISVPEHAWIYVQVDKGLTSLGGFTLEDNYNAITQMPPYPRVVKIQHEGALLALSGERKISIESRGVEQLEFRLARITPDAINHLVSQSEGSFQSSVFSEGNFDESNISEELVRRLPIAATSAAKNDYSALDFSEFVDGRDANRGKLGLFILHVLARKAGDDGAYYQPDGSVIVPKDMNDWQGNCQDPSDRSDLLADRRIILVTDLGLIVKDNVDGTHDVFAQSIKTGEPVSGAQVDVLGKNGIAVVSVKTDDEGHAAIPALGDFTREQMPVAYVVRRVDDVSFLPFGRADRELNFTRFDTAGLTGVSPNDLTAFVFTDRGIYRPGDEAKLGLVVKRHDWQGQLEGVPLRLDVVDPSGTTVQSRVLKLNAAGFLDTTFATRETSRTGTYEVDCYLVKGGNDDVLLGSTTLRVAEFLPDRMKIQATLSATSPEGWVNGSGLKATVLLQNLYGAPSVGHRMTGKVTLDPSQFSFDKFTDYIFTDPYATSDGKREHREQDLPEQTTDNSGSATFDVSLPELGPSAYRLSFFAEGFEKEGGRSVTTGAEVLVSPRAWLVGYKPDGDFGYVKFESKRAVRFLAVDSQLNPLAVDHLKLKLAQLSYVSVLTQKPNGNYSYESVQKETPVGEQELAIPAVGLDWTLNTAQPGDFVARLYDESGALVAEVRYSVVGAGNVTRSLAKNAELTAKLSKPEYLPGEDVEVEITAPYTGAGLLTIERDKVYAHAWFMAKTTTTVQKIKLPPGFEGNGYLNVTFVRALDSREIYMSPLSYAVLPFKVSNEARHTQITIDVPKVAKPGEPLAMTITANRPTEAIVYAVDEGILQVARYSLPDPLGYFFRRQALEVGTRQTVDLIMPEYSIAREVAAAGGDAGEDALAHHLNPFKRKHDAPVAYWSGMVDIGPQAKTFTYNVPDYFAGTLHVMVVANSPDAVGSAETKLQVRGPFVISPNVPTFVAPGDTFDVSVTVANNVAGSGPDAQVNLDLTTTDGLELLQKPAAVASIAEGRDASFHWLLRAKDQLGNADITVTASRGDERTSLASHMSIRPPVPYLTTLTSGYFKGDEKQVPVARKLYPQYRKATALVSPLPQGFTRGLGEYLEHYEYGCTEQLVSKAFPSLVGSDLMQQGLPRPEVAQKVAEILDVAATRQSDDGAFGLWCAQSGLHFDLPSAWVMLFITEAKDQGYDVPADMFTRGIGHLQQDANGTASDFFEARTQAFEIYLLARNGTVVTNALEHNRRWFEVNAPDLWHDDIASVYDAATYALLKNQDEADALISQFHLRSAKIENFRYWDDFDDELSRNSRYIYLLSLHFPERIKSITADDLQTLADPIMDGDYTTLSSAQAIIALEAYGRMMQDKMAPGSVEIDQLVNNAMTKLEVTPGFYPEVKFGGEADALLFKKGTADVPGLFYQVVESGFERAAVTAPISEGIEVSREYHDAKGHVTTTANLGDELTVVLRVRAMPAFVSNVAIEDLLPGGFEIVDDTARTGACTYAWGGINYVDVREDRLLAFGDIGNPETTITYRIKATNRGTFVIPPPQAEAMYHQKIRARGVSGTLTVD